MNLFHSKLSVPEEGAVYLLSLYYMGKNRLKIIPHKCRFELFADLKASATFYELKHHYPLKVVHHKLCHMCYKPLVVTENGFFGLLRLIIPLQTSKLMAHNKTGLLYKGK